jgi:hypothetical protein
VAHLEQRQFFEGLKQQHPSMFSGVSVLEVGSLDINGTVRDFFDSSRYVGVDVGQGLGVDVVCAGEDLTYGDGEFDMCVSAECFEHNPEWLATFRNMVRMAGRFVVFTCATVGRAEHGTSRCHPGSSPLTSTSDYYRNLTEQDFTDNIDFDSHFSRWEFSTEESSCDLRFFGIKHDAVI